MKCRLALLSLAAVGVAHAQTVSQISVQSGHYVAGASRDNQTWFVKTDGGQGGGFWTSGGYTALQAPTGSLGVIEPYKMSSNGQWIVGNAAYEQSGYIIYLPVLWNSAGQATTLTMDMSFETGLSVSDDGTKVLMSALGGGAGVWNNGVIEGKPWTQAYDMSANGNTLSFGQDVGPYQVLGFNSVLAGNAVLPMLNPDGGGVSGDGTRIFGFGTPSTFERNHVVDLYSGGYDVTDLGIAQPGLGARGLVSYDGSIAGWSGGYWKEGRGRKTLASMGFGSNYTVTSVGNDDRHIFLRDMTTGNDYVIDASAVPEPATMAALGLGAAALLRRRKKA